MNELLHTMSLVKIELPSIELMALLAIMSLAMVFRFPRTGLMAAYIFSYRWGWMAIMDYSPGALVAYMVFGILVGTLSVIGFLRNA